MCNIGPQNDFYVCLNYLEARLCLQMKLQKWWMKCKIDYSFFLNASDWSRLLSPWRFKTFPAMCGSPSDTRAPVHIEQPLCTVCMVPGPLTLKPCSGFFLGAFKCSQTSLQMWTQMMFFYLQPLGAASSACFTMPWKSTSNQFSPLPQSGSVDYWQQVLFSKITDCLHVVPTTNWTSRIRQKHSCSPPTQSAGWTWTLITHHLYTNRIFLSFLRPPPYESVLVSIATGLVPPSFAVVSSPPVLYNNTVYSTQKVKWLQLCLMMFVSVTLVIIPSKLRQHTKD